MGRRRSRARPGRKKGNKCVGCGQTLHTYAESFCVRCEAKKAARAELFAKSSPRLEEKKEEKSVLPNPSPILKNWRKKKEEEKKMHIPSMGK